MRYLISYDLLKPGKNYDSLWAELRGMGAERQLASQWTVTVYGATTLTLARQVAQHLDANDRLLVNELPENYAYVNLMGTSKAA